MDGDVNRNKDKDDPWASQSGGHRQEKAEDMKLWGVFIFGLIGATVTTFAVGRLRKTVDLFYTELSRSMKGGTGSFFRSPFQEGARKRYNQRLREEYEDEMERVERIRRMQSVFNRERNTRNKRYESWRENDFGAYNEHFQREDWYWKTDTFYKDKRTNHRESPMEGFGGSHALSQHYSVLGLDRFRGKPYTDAEIKTAFRAKALEFHPDQNQENKDAAEAKFKEVMVSFEAIKKERNTKNL